MYMKKLSFSKIGLIAPVACCFVFFSCIVNSGNLSGQIVKETREVPAFSGIDLAFSGTVYVTQGNENKVVIEADKSIMDIIETRMNGDHLVLKTRNGNWKNMGEVKIYITMTHIDHLSVSGSGNMECQSLIQTSDLEIDVSGSGSVNLQNLKASAISAVVTGSGDIELAGSSNTSRLEATITGSGSIKAAKLAVDDASVNITGSGSAQVNALKQLETQITGSGNVLYKGNPVVNANSTGSGRTRQME
jgi:hypothetical protein